MWKIWRKAAAAEREAWRKRIRQILEHDPTGPAAAVLRKLLEWSKRRDRQVMARIERQKQRRPFYVSG